MILFDSNILIYSQTLKDERSAICRKWIKKSENGEIKGVISSQNLTEFVSVMIKNSQILKQKVQINNYIKTENHLQKFFKVIFPNNQTVDMFNNLIIDKTISPRRVYDVFLAATMLSNGVNEILTYNVKDFVDFKEIKVISPEI